MTYNVSSGTLSLYTTTLLRMVTFFLYDVTFCEICGRKGARFLCQWLVFLLLCVWSSMNSRSITRHLKHFLNFESAENVWNLNVVRFNLNFITSQQDITRDCHSTCLISLCHIYAFAGTTCHCLPAGTLKSVILIQCHSVYFDSISANFVYSGVLGTVPIHILFCICVIPFIWQLKCVICWY